MDKAFEYIIEKEGIATESSYPYKGSDGISDQQKATNISVGEEFLDYGEWIFCGSCYRLNHAVTIMGCGCYWAFSTVAAIEEAFKIKNDQLLKLSELSVQQLVNCDTINGGCNSGCMDNAFGYIIEKRSNLSQLELALGKNFWILENGSSMEVVVILRYCTGEDGTKYSDHHAVTIVRYCTGEDGIKYRLIKNSYLRHHLG
ncbi:hypothetical protein Dsin_020951 [Dipteronia sinensis]|uniref:Peptidase C1A papain C-terminal domain-containing protein n=1 Tax=Dipteronia sinensis TaxID=43782 RepID=A0AAE0E452_9ROSI|nr:hypothetical protein Dsin_020951 [Dipteronia sinensis]